MATDVAERTTRPNAVVTLVTPSFQWPPAGQVPDGRREKLMTVIENGDFPPAEWFVGRKPRDVESYPPVAKLNRDIDFGRPPGGGRK